jgi:hypothetical protein
VKCASDCKQKSFLPIHEACEILVLLKVEIADSDVRDLDFVCVKVVVLFWT